MSRYDYEMSKKIVELDLPFAALIMAAMRQADTGNRYALAYSFPTIDLEVQARYDAPGGVLESDNE